MSYGFLRIGEAAAVNKLHGLNFSFFNRIILFCVHANYVLSDLLSYSLVTMSQLNNEYSVDLVQLQLFEILTWNYFSSVLHKLLSGDSSLPS